MFEQLQAEADAKGLITWDVSVDSTIARAHRHAAGARKKRGTAEGASGGVDTEPDDHGLGRSRGGLTTKLHLAVEQGQKPLSLLVTAGHRHDSPQFQPVLKAIRVPRLGPGRPRTRPDKVRADKRLRRGMWHQPAEKAPAVATRYDKLTVRYEAIVLVTAINKWL